MENIHQNFTLFCNKQTQDLLKDSSLILGLKLQPNNQLAETFFGTTRQSQFYQNKQNKDIRYFNMLFSPKQMAQSIQRRNDNLQLLDFQNSGQEPDDVFNRRKQKVLGLMTKQEEQIQILFQIKLQDQGKYIALIEFIKFFCMIKEMLEGLRTDYYSNKTFSALKNANQSDLVLILKVFRKMYNNVMNQTKVLQTSYQSPSQKTNTIDQRIMQFLIIPRFLISRQKIIRLAKDQILQKNFEFLISHRCLGHYNNEANKKMPQQEHMVYVRELMNKKFGKQKFKKISSINHGNKFFKSHGKAYYELYSKSLQYLKQLDILIKKGKKYENIKKQLNKIPQDQEDERMKPSLGDTENSNSNSNSNSNHNVYNFQSLEQCLNKAQNSLNSSQSIAISQQIRDQPVQIQPQMIKRRTKKLMSMPTYEVEQKQETRQLRGFNVRKSHTMQVKTTQNIILIPPPSFNFQC